jgi:hypothetical protein
MAQKEMPDLRARFARTLIAMWNDPLKRRMLEGDGVTERDIDEAKRSLIERM